MADRDKKARDAWGSRIGVVPAAAGCAIGLGNFLRSRRGRPQRRRRCS